MPPATRPCADLRACARDLQVVSKAPAGHTCQTLSARSRWPSAALPLLPPSGLFDRAPRRANDKCLDNWDITGLRVSQPRSRPRISARNIDPAPCGLDRLLIAGGVGRA